MYDITYYLSLMSHTPYSIKPLLSLYPVQKHRQEQSSHLSRDVSILFVDKTNIFQYKE